MRFKSVIKRVLENVIGRKIIPVPTGHYLYAKPATRSDLWFHYPEVLKRLFARLKIGLVLDVGANTGQYGEFLRKEAGYRGELHSIEPTSAAFVKLSELAKGDRNWKTHNLALGSENSQRTINVSKMSVFSSFLESNEFSNAHFGDIASNVSEEVVAIRRLEDFLHEQKIDISRTPTFLKMDTQGFDLEVFGGLGVTAQMPVLVQSEICLLPIYHNAPVWTRSLTMFEQSGYGIVGMFPVNRTDEIVIEYDCLMMRNENNNSDPAISGKNRT